MRGNQSGITGPREAWPDDRAMSRAAAMTDSYVLLREEQGRRRQELPEAATFHRLPLTWYKAKVGQLKAEARRRGVDGGLLLTSYWNLIYATGLLHTPTERPFACFLPMDDDEAAIWLYPYLDEGLVRGWWCTQGFSYFDYPHAGGSAANLAQVTQGPTVNIFQWWGETLRKLGYGGKTIGIESGGLAEIGLVPGGELSPRLDLFEAIAPPGRHRPGGGAFGLVASAMPEAWFVDISDILIRHRAVKDDWEHRLTQRAMDYFSEIHAFARNYLLERGPGILDWEVANAATFWGMHRIMQDVPQRGEPHNAVGIGVQLACRTGRGTAYPHPNQMLWTRIERGHALQLAGIVRVGGYGGELYRSFLIAPWTDWQEHVWEVHTHCHHLQAQEAYAGNTGSAVARVVHEYQVANGCAHLVYHRPGHGQGMEGHQPPYHALGDYTVLRKGMHFSNEPGLFDLENGFGFNHGNNILVAEGKGLQTGTAPVNREWCLLRF